MSKFDSLYDQKYILLETYKKDGTSVKTPVWFVIVDDLIHVVTRKETGKIKRLKNNKSVKISPCTFNGKITGESTSGNAEFATEEKSKAVIQKRKEKYGFMETIARFVSKNRGELTVFSIQIE